MILLNGKVVEFGSYPNGETYLKSVISTQDVANEVNEFTLKYENDSDLLKLLFLKEHVETMVLSDVELTIYYMPYSRMDRSEGGSMFTLKYASKLINDMNFQTVYVIEPHSDVTTALLDRVIPIFVTKTLLDSTLNEVDFDLENDFVVYPDAGAQKRYAKFFDGNVLVAHKERDFKTGYIKKLDILGVPYPKPEGRKAIIVDDLCSKGGTFILTAKALKEQGFSEIYLVVAHCENTIFQGEILSGNLIDKVFTSNTIVSSTQNGWDDDYKDKLDISNVEDLLGYE